MSTILLAPFRGEPRGLVAGTASSAGHGRHRTTVASTARRQGACAPGPALEGRRATSLGLGAATGTSAASVTFAWWIRASWLIRCTPEPYAKCENIRRL